MRQRRRTPREHLTPIECHRRSRRALVDRVLGCMAEGEGLASIARHPNMPRHATFQRWLATDAGFRRLHASAQTMQRHVMADDMIADADRAAAVAIGRKKIAAVRRQIEARRRLVELVAAGAKDLKASGKPDRPRVGLSDAGVAMLEKAVEDLQASASGDSPKDERKTEDEQKTCDAEPTPPRPAPDLQPASVPTVGKDTHRPDASNPSEPKPNSWWPRDEDLRREPVHERDWDPFEW